MAFQSYNLMDVSGIRWIGFDNFKKLFSVAIGNSFYKILGNTAKWVLISLALFLTMFVMAPTFEKSWEQGIKPMIDEKVEMLEGLEKASVPLKEFMVNNTREKDLLLFSDLSQSPKAEKVSETPLKVVVPAFMISELRRAFEIGFLIFIPFLIIDMIIASVLMSMGMMMLPPTVLAMPFKIIFFVLVDGWYLLAGSLVQSFK